MRVVAGEFRGRRLSAPGTAATRPTTDRVREAVFNALSSLDIVVGATVADLYAGSGALGIEALSRGAKHCTFVEKDRAALSAIHDNIAALGIAGRTRVVSGDAVVMSKQFGVDIAFAERNVAVGIDERLGLRRTVERKAESDRRRRAVIVGQRELPSEAGPEGASGASRVVAPGTVAREPHPDAPQVERVRRRNQITFVLNDRNLADVHVVARGPNRPGGPSRPQGPSLVQSQRVKDVITRVAVDPRPLLCAQPLVRWRAEPRERHVRTGIGIRGRGVRRRRGGRTATSTAAAGLKRPQQERDHG